MSAIKENKMPAIFHYLVVTALCIGFRFLPSIGGLSPEAMGVLGCFIGVIYGWVAIDMLWPSLIAMLGLGMSLGIETMLAESFGSITIVALILCMGVFGVAMKSGAFNWLVQIMLGSKALQGKSWVTIWLIFFIAFLMGGANPIIMCIVFCAFADSMFEQVGIQKNDKLVIFMYLGMTVCLMLGQILLPFVSTGLILLMSYNRMFPTMPLDTAGYMVFMIIMGIVMVTTIVLAMKFIFRVDASAIANYKNDGEKPKIERAQKISLIAFGLFILINVVAALPIPGVKAFLGQFGIVGFAIIFTCILGVLKDEKGGRLVDIESCLSMSNWGQITMVGVIMIIAACVSNPELGITALMAGVIKPFTALPPLVFVVVALLLAVILTNIANNMIVVVIVMPFIVSFSLQIGMAPTGIVCLLFLVSQFALLTPAASPVTAVAMTQKMADPKEMMKAAIKLVPILGIVAIAIGWPLSQIVF